MRNSRWQPTLLIRASIALHLLALIVVIAEPGQWRWALGAVLANHALLTLVGLWPRSHWLGPNWTRLPAAAAARNEIALTIRRRSRSRRHSAGTGYAGPSRGPGYLFLRR